MKPLHKIVETTKPYTPAVVKKPAAVVFQFRRKELEQEAKALTKKLGEVNNNMQKKKISFIS